MEALFNFFSIFFPYRMIRGIKYFGRKIYSYSASRYLKKCGKNPNIVPDAWIEGGKYIEVGDNFSARSGLRLETYDYWNGVKFSPKIEIGDNFNAGELCHIGAINEIVIGDNVLIGSKVLIIDHNHGNTGENDLTKPPMDRDLISRGKIYIGDNVWIGDNVVIMANVVIGHNSVIGANSIITKDVKPYSKAIGVTHD